MKTIKGTSNRYLEVNLTDKSWSIYTPPLSYLDDYIGGKGMAMKLYYDRLGDKMGSIDPLSADNLLIITTGLLIGTGAPCSGRFEAVTKSPLTGIMVSSSCGGPFGYALKTAGYDGMIISGKASTATALRIGEYTVDFEDASQLTGLSTSETQKKVLQSPADGALAIGPAGENQVLYANIASGHRFLGRGGMGAVMGSKNLKAVTVRGRSCKIEPVNTEAFRKINSRAKNHIGRNSFTKSYRNYGTNANVNPGVDAGYAPVYNFRDRTDERCRALSGELMAERYKTERETCIPCTVLCGHAGSYPDGHRRAVPEYETIGLWGGNIGNFNPDTVGVLNELMNELGMDTISCGGTFAWAMEANQKGLRKSSLEFDKTDNLAELIKDTAYRRGEGAELAEGSKKLSEKYGGKDFAMHVKGLEMAAYDPRAAWGHGLGYAVANRGGCHLSSYPIGVEVLFPFLRPYSTVSKAAWVDFLENLYNVINSVHTCIFTAFGILLEPPLVKYTPRPLLTLAMTFMPRTAMALLDWSVLPELAAAVTGKKFTVKSFYEAGKRIHLLERYMNTLCGITKADDTLPGRFLNEAETKHPVKSVVPLDKMLKSYYKIKGYEADGSVKKSRLIKLGIIKADGIA
jgi:aldehyde:ferredoxin oxidoreductase